MCFALSFSLQDLVCLLFRDFVSANVGAKGADDRGALHRRNEMMSLRSLLRERGSEALLWVARGAG